MIVVWQQPLHKVFPNARHVTTSLATDIAKPLHRVRMVATFVLLLLLFSLVFRGTRPGPSSLEFRLRRDVVCHHRGGQTSPQLLA